MTGQPPFFSIVCLRQPQLRGTRSTVGTLFQTEYPPPGPLQTLRQIDVTYGGWWGGGGGGRGRVRKDRRWPERRQEGRAVKARAFNRVCSMTTLRQTNQSGVTSNRVCSITTLRQTNQSDERAWFWPYLPIIEY